MLAASKGVLIMDDDEVVCRSYERVLAGAGYRVRSARSGPAAIEEARERPFDIVLADLKMPGMDGLTAIRKLREQHPNLRAVVVTGYPSDESAEEAERLGVIGYLTKPLAPDELTRATAEALEKEPPPLLAEKQPVAAVDAEAAAEVATAPTIAEVEAPRERPSAAGIAKNAAALVAAPLIGLVYVMFLPFIGFAILFGSVAQRMFGRGVPRVRA